MISLLFGDNSKKPDLLYSGEISDIHATTIYNEIICIINPLVPNNFWIGNFKLILLDGAYYRKKIYKMLKQKFTHIKHVVCLAHNLDITIRDYFTLATIFTTLFEKIFKNNAKQGIIENSDKNSSSTFSY